MVPGMAQGLVENKLRVPFPFPFSWFNRNPLVFRGISVTDFLIRKLEILLFHPA